MDIDAQLDAVDRGIATGTREGADTYVQTVAQTYPAPIDDVWDALTSAERLPRWFLPVSGDLRLGGRYAIEGNASGTVESCDAPNSFGVTWEFGGGIDLAHRAPRRGRRGRTRVELEHVAPSADVGAEMWEQFGPSATGIGWDQTLLGLAQHLTTGEVKPENAAGVARRRGGHALHARSADRWAARARRDGRRSRRRPRRGRHHVRGVHGRGPGPDGLSPPRGIRSRHPLALGSPARGGRSPRAGLVLQPASSAARDRLLGGDAGAVSWSCAGGGPQSSAAARESVSPRKNAGRFHACQSMITTPESSTTMPSTNTRPTPKMFEPLP